MTDLSKLYSIWSFCNRQILQAVRSSFHQKRRIFKKVVDFFHYIFLFLTFWSKTVRSCINFKNRLRFNISKLADNNHNTNPKKPKITLDVWKTAESVPPTALEVTKYKPTHENTNWLTIDPTNKIASNTRISTLLAMPFESICIVNGKSPSRRDKIYTGLMQS